MDNQKIKFVLSPVEMKRFDRITCKEMGIDDLILMEHAGRKSAEIMERQLLEPDDKIAIFCGTGNNGGDGMVLARWLFNHEYDVHCYIVGDEQKFSSLAKKNFKILQKLSCKIEFIREISDIQHIENILPSFDVTVDALFGIGLKGKIEGYRKDLIECINQKSNTIVAIDIPSGVDAENGKVANVAIKADYTITMADPKYGHLLYPGRELKGEIFVVDIGIPPSIYRKYPPKAEIISDIKPFFSPRSRNSHKGDFGKVCIIAGSPGFTGAGIMASKAALETGAGLITLLHPESLSTIFEAALTEVITKGIGETPEHTISMQALDEILRFVEECDAVAIGPGLSRNKETAEFTRKFLIENTKPAVIDADGINAFEGFQQELEKLPGKPYIFTPHIKEFERLTGTPAQDILQNELAYACKFAKNYKLTLLLKGSTSIITDGNRITFNLTGNPGMSTGGSGDVLTGIIVALLGQGFSTYRAAGVGAYIHGKVADILAPDIGEPSITPTKLIQNIYRVIS
jgi:NAD(P)H-hydrate epimerase